MKIYQQYMSDGIFTIEIEPNIKDSSESINSNETHNKELPIKLSAQYLCSYQIYLEYKTKLHHLKRCHINGYTIYKTQITCHFKDDQATVNAFKLLHGTYNGNCDILQILYGRKRKRSVSTEEIIEKVIEPDDTDINGILLKKYYVYIQLLNPVLNQDTTSKFSGSSDPTTTTTTTTKPLLRQPAKSFISNTNTNTNALPLSSQKTQPFSFDTLTSDQLSKYMCSLFNQWSIIYSTIYPSNKYVINNKLIYYNYGNYPVHVASTLRFIVKILDEFANNRKIVDPFTLLNYQDDGFTVAIDETDLRTKVTKMIQDDRAICSNFKNIMNDIIYRWIRNLQNTPNIQQQNTDSYTSNYKKYYILHNDHIYQIIDSTYEIQVFKAKPLDLLFSTIEMCSRGLPVQLFESKNYIINQRWSKNTQKRVVQIVRR